MPFSKLQKKAFSCTKNNYGVLCLKGNHIFKLPGRFKIEEPVALNIIVARKFVCLPLQRMVHSKQISSMCPLIETKLNFPNHG